jgi:SAM-dependent methyltransferase
LALPEFESILVVGAGHDPYRGIFPNTKEYIRLDVEPVPGITDVVGDALSLPFEGNRFDCIFATEVMEHLSDPHIFVKEVGRVLKQGGTVILSVPFMFHRHADPHDFWRPTDTALRDLFSGFKEVAVTPHGNRLHVISDLVTTAFARFPLFFPLRIFNHILGALPGPLSRPSTAPSGYLLVGIK